jgi:hypothetical protein
MEEIPKKGLEQYLGTHGKMHPTVYSVINMQQKDSAYDETDLLGVL